MDRHVTEVVAAASTTYVYSTAAHATITDSWCHQGAGTHQCRLQAGLLQRTDEEQPLTRHRLVKKLDRLRVTQISAARMMWQASRSTSATELLQQLHLLPVRQRYTVQSVVYHLTTHGNFARYRNLPNPQLIIDYLPARTLRSADKLSQSINHDWRC